jgi:hypothetical protein
MQMWHLILPMFFIFSMTCLALGFVALLKQKLYIDSKTNQLTEVDLPIVGKMRTNYPALVFVIAGCAAMFPVYSMYQAASDDKEDYLITGKVEIDRATTTGESRRNAASLNFAAGIIVPFPTDTNIAHVERNGGFSFTIKVPKGKKFEEQIQTLQLNHPDLIGSINTGAALNNPRALIQSTQNSRDYRLLVEESTSNTEN